MQLKTLRAVLNAALSDGKVTEVTVDQSYEQIGMHIKILSHEGQIDLSIKPSTALNTVFPTMLQELKEVFYHA